MKNENGNVIATKKILTSILLFVFVTIGLLGISPTTRIHSQILQDQVAKGINISADDMTIDYLWNRTWGTVQRELGRDLAVDMSGNVYITGENSTLSGPIVYDGIVLKYDNEGNLLWNASFGDDFNGESGTAIAVDDSGNIFIAGFLWNQSLNDFDALLVKYDSLGVQQWNTTWGGNNVDEGRGVALDTLGNVYLVGDSDSLTPGYYDAFCAKFNGTTGIQQWNTTWGGSEHEFGYGIAVNSAGDIYISGHTTSYGEGFQDMFLVKFNNEGIKQWNTTWGTTDYDRSVDLVLDSDENIYIVGESHGFGAFYCPVVVKYNPSGTQLWEVVKTGSSATTTRTIATDLSGNMYIAGDIWKTGRSYEAFITCYNGSGTLLCDTTWGDLEAEYCHGIAVDPDGDLFIIGETQSFGEGDYDAYLVKLEVTIPNPPPPNPKVPGYFTWAILAILSLMVLIKVRWYKKQ